MIIMIVLQVNDQYALGCFVPVSLNNILTFHTCTCCHILNVDLLQLFPRYCFTPMSYPLWLDMSLQRASWSRAPGIPQAGSIPCSIPCQQVPCQHIKSSRRLSVLSSCLVCNTLAITAASTMQFPSCVRWWAMTRAFPKHDVYIFVVQFCVSMCRLSCNTL